jgi:hypothetical protein
MLAMIMLVFFGVAPVMLLSVSMLQSVSIEQGVSEPGLSQLYMALIPAVATPLALTLTPDYPAGISVVFEKKTSRLLKALFTTGTVVLVLPAVAGVLTSDLEVFGEYAFAGLDYSHRARGPRVIPRFEGDLRVTG